MTPPINVVDQYIPLIAQAVTKWQEKNTPETIRNYVHRMLDKASNEIVMKLLGFNDSWGKWELDHCNGRSGNSPAGEFITKVQQSAVQDWLATVTMPKLTKEVRARLEKQAQSEYEQHMRNAIREKARQLAEADAKTLVTALTQSQHINNYLAAMQLITQEGEEDAS